MKPRELRSKSVGTKVTEAELRVLESRAERAGLTLSEWVRDVLLGSSVEMGTLAAERAILAEVLAMRTILRGHLPLNIPSATSRHYSFSGLPLNAARAQPRREATRQVWGVTMLWPDSTVNAYP